MKSTEVTLHLLGVKVTSTSMKLEQSNWGVTEMLSSPSNKTVARPVGSFPLNVIKWYREGCLNVILILHSVLLMK